MISKSKTQKSLIIVGLAAAALNAQAQEKVAQPEKIDELPLSTVLASRFDSAVKNTTSSVSVLDRNFLDLTQEHRLIESIKLIPGVQGTSTAGQRGNFESLLIRGLGTGYAQVVVDGVAISDSANPLNNFLSNTSLGLVNRVELLRGPQSVLYGSNAAGGVLGYDTTVGGKRRSELFAEAGSFDSYRAGISSRGSVGKLDYGIGFSREFTSNDTYTNFPLQDYTVNSSVLGLQYRANENLKFKLSYRNGDGDLKTRAFSFGSFSNSRVNTDYHLFALNTDLKINDKWSSKLTIGYYDEAYDGVFGASNFFNDYHRFSLNWSNNIQLNDQLEFVVGTEYARSSYRNNTADFDYNTKAAFATSYWRPVNGLLVETGVRYDDHSTYGGETAWNVGAAYELASNTRLRARVAQSYRTPRVVDSQAFTGLFSRQIANPNLKTEEILGYEIGVDQEFGDHTAQLTLFRQNLENAVATQNIAAGVNQRQNLAGKSSVSGIELALGGKIVDKLNYRVSYTFQDQQEVIDVPDHNLNVDVHYDAGKWLVGMGASYQDGASYAAPSSGFASQTDSRFVTRLYGHYKINDSLKFHGRVENVFNEDYNVSNFGTPLQGQGFGAFAGFTYAF